MLLALVPTTMRVRALVLLLTSLFVVGCTGTVLTPADAVPLDEDGPALPEDPRVPIAGGGGGGTGGGPVDGGGNVQLPPAVPGPSARIARLTHPQWTATVHYLFGLDSTAPDWAAGFRSDPNQSGFLFDNDADALVVDQTLQDAYRRAAEEVAAYVTPGGDLARLAAYLPASGTDVERARGLAAALGERVHRRPLTPAEVDAYVSVFQTGTQYPMGQSAFVGGVRLMLEAMLVSPAFLYRVERSEAVVDGVVPLDPFEIASRLSYFLWNTMPDDLLFEAARQGTLTDPAEVRRQAERMLADPRATEVAQRYHEVLLDLGRYDNIAPSPADFPNVPRNLSALARQETRMVLRDAFESDLGWTELLTSSETFVNEDLAPLYGLQGSFGVNFQRVSLHPGERRGLFTQIGFLTSHATSLQPDPIHRGVFLTERIACNDLGAPPANLPPLPPPEGRTNREVVADHTEQPGTVCAGCHTTLINPFGFAYENYDAAGMLRTTDNGHPVQTQADPLIGGERRPVSGALELADELAKSDAVHACYAEHWLELAFGRSVLPPDEGLIARLAYRSRQGGSIRELLADLVSSPAFLNRASEELP